MFEVLTDKEVKTLGKLWCKEKLLFSKLTKEDVLRLVDFAERVRKYREAFKREKSRQRMERARKKLQEAAENGDSVAIRKIKKNQKSGNKMQLAIKNESQGESHSVDSTLIYCSYYKTITEKHASKLKEEKDTHNR